jgi:DNA helicase II / ATP-dependent DNA helicase PcrA
MSVVLNEEQKKAVEHKKGPLLIIAGAGTGKTAVITQRIVFLIKNNLVSPSEILALTFMEKAANEMIERVDQAMPLGYEEAFISTFHSFCDRILRQEAFFLGIDPNYKLMSEAESYVFFRKNIFKFPLDSLRPLSSPSKFIDVILKHFSRLQDEDVTPDEYLKYVSSKKGKLEDSEFKEIDELSKTYKIWSELKEAEGKMSFGDLIANTLRLFRTKPHILKKYQEKFKYVLVDEFQDTNYSQNILVNTLMLGSDFEKATQEQRKNANITVVGDDDQAIYKFRGAAISNILQFKEIYPSAERIVLTKNYRSRQEILDAAYGLIKNNNPYRLEETEGINKRLQSLREPAKGVVSLIFAADVVEEADSIAKEILNVVGKEKTDVQKFDSKGQASFLEKTEKETYKYSDVAILVRANSHADDIVSVLRYHGIPYKFAGKKALYSRPEVKFLISYLKLVCDYKDNLSLFNLLQMDVWDLKTRDFVEIFSNAKREKISAFEFLESVLDEKKKNFVEKTFSKKALKSITLLMGLLENSFQMVKKGSSVSEMLLDFFKDSGFWKSLEKDDTAENNFKIQNISKFFELVKKFEQDNKGTNIYDYVDYLEYSVEIGEMPSIEDDVFAEYDAVNIFTVHGAKGLEFPVVFLVSLVKGRFPSRNMSETLPVPNELKKEQLPDEGEKADNIQEERRLFYVAATRAKDMLFLTAAQGYGEGKRKNKPSVFLNELLERDVTGELSDVVKKNFNFVKNVCTVEEEIDPKMLSRDFGKRISYSEINDYEVCPKKYRYKYVLKVPVRYGHAATFGSIIHLTLKNFYRLLKSSNEGFEGFIEKPTLEDLYRLYEDNWRNDGFESKKHEEEQKKKGYKILEKFFNDIYTGDERILDLEKRFKFSVEDIIVTGAVDRIDSLDEKGEVVELIDYKTGKTRDRKDVEKDIQLIIYGIFAKESMDVKKIKASLLFLDEGIKIETEIDEKKMEEVRKKVVDVAKLIRSCKFEPKPGFQTCKYCDYKDVCEDVFI